MQNFNRLRQWYYLVILHFLTGRWGLYLVHIPMRDNEHPQLPAHFFIHYSFYTCELDSLSYARHSRHCACPWGAQSHWRRQLEGKIITVVTELWESGWSAENGDESFLKPWLGSLSGEANRSGLSLWILVLSLKDFPFYLVSTSL